MDRIFDSMRPAVRPVVVLLASVLLGALTVQAQEEGSEATAEAQAGVTALLEKPAEATAEGRQIVQDLLSEDAPGDAGYDDEGRRDPFINPLDRLLTAAGDEPVRPPGWDGMLIREVQLWGLTVYGEQPIAIFRGSDGLGYFKREADELWDGKIVSIDFDGGEVVFQQRVEDPTSPVRFREVVQKLNP